MSWWIAESERTVTEVVPAPPDAVRDFYVDLDSLQVVHPLIVSVKELSREDLADGGYRQTYRVVDRLKLGPVSFRTAYVAAWQVPPHGDVLTEADQSPSVSLRGTVSFDPVDAGTRLTERIRISAPRPLAGFTTREAVKAHTAMLASIRAHFEKA
ncbi:SRPBCC family protein [Nocardioides sp. CN2-186]|uniref:SRPBCC family protein n=1 Tax=Nocardioides tweenelious TaxID=3156607 RepID=UPI0032B42DDE